MEKMIIIYVLSLMVLGCVTNSQSSSQSKEFIKKYNEGQDTSDHNDEFTIRDVVKNPRPGSADEAAGVLAIVEHVLSKQDPLNQRKGGDYKSIDPNLSLEALSYENGINLPEALKNNESLKTPEIFKKTLKASEISKNSPTFNASVKKAIGSQVALFNLESPIKTKPTSDEYAYQDFQGQDSILLQAHRLADKGEYINAVLEAKKIGEKSPFYSEAQASIIRFSSKAVKELRMKAANSFQSSLPVADSTSAKAEYLREAKQFLSDALNNFPDAPSEQLATVRKNLAVITEDLERIESENN